MPGPFGHGEDAREVGRSSVGLVLPVVLVGYFGLVLAIAVWTAFRTHTEEDFLAAGRSIGPFVGGAVLAATQISAGTVLAF